MLKSKFLYLCLSRAVPYADIRVCKFTSYENIFILIICNVCLTYFRQGKVKFSLCLIKHKAMKTYRGTENTAPPFITLVLVGGEWSVSRPCRFTPGKESPVPIVKGGWVGPRIGVLTLQEERTLSSLSEIES
jgi:hypothetical protein